MRYFFDRERGMSLLVNSFSIYFNIGIRVDVKKMVCEFSEPL